jgi:MarR family 2-MHQ and catechol resistance regulon transcriptional repressor
LPVNTINPIVDLAQARSVRLSTASSQRVLVSRVDGAEDRRMRVVALIPRGKVFIDSAFRKHSLQMKRVLSEQSPEELRDLAVAMKKVGKRAAALMEEAI